MAERRPLIIVDPGHGGQDPGAINPTSLRRESALNLALAQAFERAAIGAPFDVKLLRTRDEFQTLEGRAQRANEMGADAVLSFHCNAAESAEARGFEIWTTKGETAADFLATCVFLALEDVIPTIGRTDYDDGDPDKEAQFYILRKTLAPAILIEFGFITNAQDEAMLADPEKQDILATAVHKGIETWLGPA